MGLILEGIVSSLLDLIDPMVECVQRIHAKAMNQLAAQNSLQLCIALLLGILNLLDEAA